MYIELLKLLATKHVAAHRLQTQANLLLRLRNHNYLVEVDYFT